MSPGTPKAAKTDGHPLNPLTRFEPWSTRTARDLLDPEVLSAEYWKNTDDDGDRERRRQAELLVYSHVSLNEVRAVACRTTRTAKEVVAVLHGHGQRIPVHVATRYYYSQLS